ncbi:imidazole glycerol phosphate synthase subunit HisF [Eisenibacter elegans]|jgi:cyclase|uniref:imidazole glycerol phosphate synthase subunit HisF n=1 Tax=Eisenibacter elegans TaxID=997 RepID=UPI00047A8969|nr:imidazole glycerol phosphate synthase subunit HisF [Eisenibacter elegans]
MLTKRIIPCLDVKDGLTVKGVQFENLVVAGDAVELGSRYAAEGADELCFLDITATNEKRKTLAELVKRIAAHINIPFTVGGGISSVEDVWVLLNAGADKVTINSAAVYRPELISEAAQAFGAQCIVVAIDAKAIDGHWWVHTHGGRRAIDRRLNDWAKEAQERGAGEILFTAMNADGTKNGFALEATAALSQLLSIPIIASGGAGKPEHFKEVFQQAQADAALAASIFHFNEIGIPELKKYLEQEGVRIRP